MMPAWRRMRNEKFCLRDGRIEADELCIPVPQALGADA